MPRKRNSSEDWFACPCCGAELPGGAKFCRECGASEDSGWGDKADQGADDSSGGYGEEDDFDYDEFIRREFPEHAPSGARLQPKRLVLIVLVVLVCLALLIWALSPAP